ncbi:MAG: fasciclin domain-containing protein [Planctomycetota bacterium]
MSTKTTLVAIVMAGAVTLCGTAAAQCGASAGHSPSKAVSAKKPNVVETAVAAGSFKTLVAAVKAAGLADALQGDGPFTVFAPTDEAFAKLPKGTVEKLLEPGQKANLAAILTYHVVPGNLDAKHVASRSYFTSLNGQRVDIKVDDHGVQIDGANIVKTDIKCGNGTIHVIDTVILPAAKNVVETAAGAGKFNTLIAAAKAAGLVGALTGDGPLTVFAPTDAAFAKLPAGTVESLLQPENRDKLATILKYHVVAGRVYADGVKGSPSTLAGLPVATARTASGVQVGGANVVAADLEASNGVIHVIDSVLLPE